MTFSQALACSCLRSFLIAVLSLFLGPHLEHWIRSASGTIAWRRWLAVLIPFFTPGLLVGFCYRDTTLAISRFPAASEFVYFVLTAGMTIPVSAFLLTFLPPPRLTQEAHFLVRLASQRRINSPRNRLRLLILGRWGQRILAAAAVFLVSFQETEVASLLRAATWTEWLFTRQAGGLINPPGYLLPVVCIELVCMALVLPHFTKPLPGNSESVKSTARFTTVVSIVWTSVAVVCVTFLPLVMLIRGSLRGAGIVWQQPSFPGEIGDALLVSATAASLVAGLLWLANQPRARSWRKGWLLLLGIPGLLGPMSLGLLLAEIFQTPALRGTYDTPIPLIIGETLYLLPRGIVLWSCLLSVRRPALHLADQLRLSKDNQQSRQAGDLIWQQAGQHWFWCAAMLGFWAYFDLLLPYLLAPPGMAPAPLLLYNELHYGRLTSLAAKLLVTLLIPAVCLLLIWCTRRSLTRWLLS